MSNERELTHKFGSRENGFINLGLGSNVSEDEIIDTFIELLNNFELREELAESMRKIDLKHGYENIMNILRIKYRQNMRKKELKTGQLDFSEL